MALLDEWCPKQNCPVPVQQQGAIRVFVIFFTFVYIFPKEGPGTGLVLHLIKKHSIHSFVVSRFQVTLVPRMNW